MYTDPHYEDEDEEKENTQGMKLFAVSSETKAFLKQHVSKQTDSHEKHGVPRLATTACPKVDKILKQNLSSRTKARDRQLSKSRPGRGRPACFRVGVSHSGKPD